MRYFIILFMAIAGGHASAHQFTPTYPEFRPAYQPGVYVTDMQLFNNRKEINYYSIRVFDSDWNKVPFASNEKLIKIEYLGRKTISVYVRKEDVGKAAYICSKSKILANETSPSIITSRICSKLK